jgi:hypothetical protein
MSPLLGTVLLIRGQMNAEARRRAQCMPRERGFPVDDRAAAC